MPRVKRKKVTSGAPAVSFNATKELISQEARQKLDVIENAMGSRKMWGDLLGQTHGGDRDVYTEAGWKKNPTFLDYKNKFERQDVAGTLVSAYPDATWREAPTVREDDSDEDTEFETAFKKHAEEVNLWSYLRRVDVMAGVGQYAALLLGTEGTTKATLSKPADKTAKVIYLQPYYECDALIKEWNKDPASALFGMPEQYTLTTRIGQANASSGKSQPSGQALLVHASRVLHVAEGVLESDVFGTPRLQRVFNRLIDMEKLLASGAEGFWKSAFTGHAFIKEDDADWEGTEQDMEDQIEDYYNGLTRWMRLSGVKVHDFKATLANPKFHWEMQLNCLSAASRIPVRILTGSERGELSSNQDEGNWLSRVNERQENFAWPCVLRPYILTMVELGVLPEPKELFCDWPEVGGLNEKDKAEVAGTKATALANYASGLQHGVDLVMPPFFFLTDVMGVDEDRAREYADAAVELEDKAREEQEAADEMLRADEEQRKKDEEAERLAAGE